MRSSKRLLWFGFYDPAYARNRVLMQGLRSFGVEVAECRVDPKAHGKFGKYARLFRAAQADRRMEWDAIVVAFPGLNAVWIAKLLFRAPIVYDAFFSVFQAEIEDRKSCKPGSFRARMLYAAEWLTLRFARVVLLDTLQHVDYFVQTFGMSPTRFAAIPVGAEEAEVPPSTPLAKADGVCLVEFHGTYIPLQGIETILDAAKLLEGTTVHFRIIGNGQTAKALWSKAESLGHSNVEFIPPMPLVAKSGPSIYAELEAADIVLGIFGTGRKAMMVVPNKVYEALAVGRAIITADTPATRGLLRCGEDVFCVPPGDAEALAEAIRRLMKDVGLRERLARQGHQAYLSSFTPHAIARGLLRDLEPLIGPIDAHPARP